MPHSACEPSRLDASEFARPLAPTHPFNELMPPVRSERPYMVAALLAQRGCRVMPVHGMIPKQTGGGLECDCQPGARWLAKRDGLPVELCSMPGKKPRLRAWPDHATTELDQIAKWIDRRQRGKPSSNFAVVTGSGSGLWVLDIDGAQGFDSLDAIQVAIGALPRTWTTISGSGSGAHHWWRLPPGIIVRNSANQVAPKIDVRGENGQIIVPGSMHQSGRRYMWAEGCAPDETDLIEAPPALLTLALEACKKTRKPTRVRREGRLKHDRTDANAQPRLQDRRTANSVFGLIGDGPGRLGFHAAINSVACSFFARFGPEADPDKLKAALIQAISTAPTIDREPGYAARYVDPVRLDDAIQSARAFIQGELQ